MLSKVLHAGDIYEVPHLPGLKLATGNAGGIEIVVNGRALPLLGPMGAVRRDVALDAESLLARASQAR
jgi:cytoskeleton protein RodZ